MRNNRKVEITPAHIRLLTENCRIFMGSGAIMRC